MRNPDWLRLFPDSDFRWVMNLRPGDAVDFFSPSEESVAVLRKRSDLLRDAADFYEWLPESEQEFISLALDRLSAWTGLNFADGREAGCRLEPDWVLLREQGDGMPRVVAGSVCFPTGWSLPEKAGLPLDQVHGKVPRLNEALGRQIGTFLGKLVPGVAWERENWGFSADPSRDHHPRHRRRRLDGGEKLDEAWIRLERQILVRLSGDGILFGIHVGNHRLDEVAGLSAVLPARIARALKSMPEDAAEYKGLLAARSGIAARLEAGV